MSKPLILTIQSADPALRREVEHGVEEFADVHTPKNYADLETVKLVLDIVGGGVGIAGGVAGILTFVRSLQQTKAAQGITVNITVEAPGGPALPLAQADAELLTKLLTHA
ncbi:MAG TPA: hypothetical protein VFX76_11055 [Roseiflexaceae bacterium]|nr:hypothetical protein [Roseiflexaceae bacterium]